VRSSIRIVHTDEDVTEEVREVEAVAMRGREHEADPVDLVTHDPEVWLAMDGRDVVGFGVLVCRPDGDHYPGWYLRMAAVLPSHRGMGLQQRLIRARLAYAEKHGASVVSTYTRPDNDRSQRALYSCGFRPYFETTKYAGEMVYMRRWL